MVAKNLKEMGELSPRLDFSNPVYGECLLRVLWAVNGQFLQDTIGKDAVGGDIALDDRELGPL